jgi:hypothetical protein
VSTTDDASGVAQSIAHPVGIGQVGNARSYCYACRSPLGRIAHDRDEIDVVCEQRTTEGNATAT